MHRLPSPLSDSILKKDTLGLEALALEDIRLLAVEAASEAVCFPLFVEALRIAVQLTFFADLTTVEQSTRHLGSALRPHVRRVSGAAAPDEVAAVLEAVADAAARHEDYDGPEIQIERSGDTKVQFELEFPKTREEADLVMMGLRAKAEVSQRRLHSLQLRQAASAIRHGYEERRSAERRAAEGRGTVPADRMRLHGLRFIQGLVGAAPQIALIRGAVADFTADPTFEFIVICGPDNRFVQFAKGDGHAGLLGEVVGPAFIPKDRPFEPLVAPNLYHLGWRRPMPPADQGNLWMEWQPDWAADEIASLAITTLLHLSVLREPVVVRLGNERREVVRASERHPGLAVLSSAG